MTVPVKPITARLGLGTCYEKLAFANAKKRERILEPPYASFWSQLEPARAAGGPFSRRSISRNFPYV